MPIVVLETEKKDVKGVKEDFDVKNIKIESASKAIIETLNPASATGVSKVLNWCIFTSRFDGGKNKLNFSIKQTQDWLKKPTSNLVMEGDLSVGFYYLKGNFVSDSTQKKLLEELNKFQKNEKEEKENTETITINFKK